jgi:hypothetical protein
MIKRLVQHWRSGPLRLFYLSIRLIRAVDVEVWLHQRAKRMLIAEVMEVDETAALLTKLDSCFRLRFSWPRRPAFDAANFML